METLSTYTIRVMIIAVLRELLKRISRRVVLQRRLPNAFGAVPILVSPDSALAYWKRDLDRVDPYLLSMARELVRPGMMVWDIGANVGCLPSLLQLWVPRF